MKLRVPYFEVKRMLEKCFETETGKHCVTKSQREILKLRYFGDSLISLQEIAERKNKSRSGIALVEIEALNRVRRYLKSINQTEYITELQPTV